MFMLLAAVLMFVFGMIGEMSRLDSLGVDEILGNPASLGLTCFKAFLNFVKGKTFTVRKKRKGKM
jgi:hypothetical protein